MKSVTSAQFSARALDEWLGFAVELADVAHAMLAPAGRVRPDAVLKPDRSFVHGVTPLIQSINGCRVRYTAYPDDKSFNDDGDCMAMPEIDQAVSQVVRRLAR